MMGKPIPTLGYPSRGAAVTALRDMGKSRSEVASLLCTNRKNVQSLEYNENNKSRRKPTGERRISIGRLRNELRPYAVRRGMKVAQFVQYFLRTAIDAGLVDSILDDDVAISVAPARERRVA